MWGNKKAEPDSPPAAVPAPSKAPETNSTKPIPARVEDNVMSTDAVRPDGYNSGRSYRPSGSQPAHQG